MVRHMNSVPWGQHWPTKLVGLLASIQLILTLLVIGLEITIIGLDLSFVDEFGGTFIESRLNYPWGRYGIAAIFFYTITWISTYAVGKI